MTIAAGSPAGRSGVEVGLVGLAAAEVLWPVSVSSQPSLSVGLGEREEMSLLPLRDACLGCWLTEEF